MSDTEKPTEAVVKRLPNGQFPKGVSGNPKSGSRPQFYRDFADNKIELHDLYLQNAPRVFVELLKLITGPDTPATARISAIKEFNDRAVGKAAQSVRVTSSDDGPQYDTIDTSVLTTEVLQAITQARLPDGKA